MFRGKKDKILQYDIDGEATRLIISNSKNTGLNEPRVSLLHNNAPLVQRSVA